MADSMMPEMGAGAAPLPPLPNEEVAPPVGSKISLTADDLPELADLQPGDTLTLTLDDITEDGNYSLTVAPPAIEEPLPPEAPMEEPAVGGQEAVVNELVG